MRVEAFNQIADDLIECAKELEAQLTAAKARVEALEKSLQVEISMKSYLSIQVQMFEEAMEADLEELEEGLWSGSSFDYEHKYHIPLCNLRIKALAAARGE